MRPSRWRPWMTIAARRSFGPTTSAGSTAPSAGGALVRGLPAARGQPRVPPGCPLLRSSGLQTAAAGGLPRLHDAASASAPSAEAGRSAQRRGAGDVTEGERGGPPSLEPAQGHVRHHRPQRRAVHAVLPALAVSLRSRDHRRRGRPRERPRRLDPGRPLDRRHAWRLSIASRRRRTPTTRCRSSSVTGPWPQKDELGNSKTPQCARLRRTSDGRLPLAGRHRRVLPPRGHAPRARHALRRPGHHARCRSTCIRSGAAIDYVSDGWYWRTRQHHLPSPVQVGARLSLRDAPAARPSPTSEGRDLRRLRWISGDEMARHGIRLYHYDHVFPHQVRNKAAFYRRQAPRVCADIEAWAEAGYFTLRRPYHVERHYWLPAWIERYDGPHPPEAVRMMDDIRLGQARRGTAAHRRHRAPAAFARYRAGRTALKALDPVDRAWRWGKLQAVRASHVPGKLRQLAGSPRGEPRAPHPGHDARDRGGGPE